jgi:hypothetical protein
VVDQHGQAGDELQTFLGYSWFFHGFTSRPIIAKRKGKYKPFLCFVAF